MGFERRGNGLYYYRKRRIGKRVVSEYRGRGGLAQMCADVDGLKADGVAQKRGAMNEARASWEQLWETVEAQWGAVEVELARVMESQGFHRPKRGRWRRKRGT